MGEGTNVAFSNFENSDIMPHVPLVCRCKILEAFCTGEETIFRLFQDEHRLIHRVFSTPPPLRRKRSSDYLALYVAPRRVGLMASLRTVCRVFYMSCLPSCVRPFRSGRFFISRPSLLSVVVCDLGFCFNRRFVVTNYLHVVAVFICS